MTDHDREYERQQFQDNWLNRDEYMSFEDATFYLANDGFISLGRAEQRLRVACARGRVPSYRDDRQMKRKEWIDNEPDLDGPLNVSQNDLFLWIVEEQRKRQPSPDPALAEKMKNVSAMRGLQPLLIRLLTEKFEGKAVPDKEKREAILQTMREAHERLRTLDHATLKLAIDTYNRTF